MADIQIRGLRKSFGDACVLDDLDLDVKDGEFVTLLGPSGCGKTTSLRIVAGLERPDSGVVQIGGAEVVAGRGKTFVKPERRNLGMVFQSYALWPHMTVRQNVAYPLKRRRVAKSEIADRVSESLNLVGLEDYASRSVSLLSGGQQQRVALARAVASRPAVLLFDEPLSNLDAKLRAHMRRELKSLHARLGTTALYVTHDQVEALELSDRVAVMRDGRIQQVGTPATIFRQPANAFVADFVGFDNLVPVTVVDTSGADVLVQTAAGARMRARAGSTSWQSGAAAIVGARANQMTLRAGSRTERDNDFTATIVDTSFLGDVMLFTMLVPDLGVEVLASVPMHDLMRNGLDVARSGESVVVNLSPDEVFLTVPDCT